MALNCFMQFVLKKKPQTIKNLRLSCYSFFAGSIASLLIQAQRECLAAVLTGLGFVDAQVAAHPFSAV